MIDENLNLHCTLFIDTVDSLVGHKILEKKTQFSYCKQSIFFEAIAFTPSLYFSIHFDTFDSETY